MMDVTMLMGISAVRTERAKVSMSIRKVPPKKAVVGISLLWSVPARNARYAA